MLLEAGASPTVKDDKGDTPLHLCIPESLTPIDTSTAKTGDKVTLKTMPPDEAKELNQRIGMDSGGKMQKLVKAGAELTITEIKADGDIKAGGYTWNPAFFLKPTKGLDGDVVALVAALLKAGADPSAANQVRRF